MQGDPDLARAVLLSIRGDPEVREEIAATACELLAEARMARKDEVQREAKRARIEAKVRG